jgi:hypothetical protein
MHLNTGRHKAQHMQIGPSSAVSVNIAPAVRFRIDSHSKPHDALFEVGNDVLSNIYINDVLSVLKCTE